MNKIKIVIEYEEIASFSSRYNNAHNLLRVNILTSGDKKN